MLERHRAGGLVFATPPSYVTEGKKRSPSLQKIVSKLEEQRPVDYIHTHFVSSFSLGKQDISILAFGAEVTFGILGQRGHTVTCTVNFISRYVKFPA